MYTCLFGHYETLNELDYGPDGAVDRLCFTDDTTLTSATWTIIVVPGYFPQDPVRDQRILKILGHPELERYEETLYIDNAVKLLAPPQDILDAWLAEADLAIPLHSFRSSVRDEFEAVLLDGLDSHERVTEQRAHYQASQPAILDEVPFWSGILARRHGVPLKHLMTRWLYHTLRYSRRDQLSLNACLARADLKVNRVLLDNHASALHTWPVHSNRQSGMRLERPPNYHAQVQALSAELAGVSAERAALQHELHLYKDELAAMRASWSWRITRPLRALAHSLRRAGRTLTISF